MKISYHAWKDFMECPKKFRLQHVERAAPTVPVNEYFTLYGKLIEKFFQIYCNLWRFKTPYLYPEVIKERLERLWLGIDLSSVVNWSAPFVTKTKDQIFEEVFKDICAIMESETLNYFLNSQSELTIQLTLANSNILSGRLDFVHNNLDKSILIFDGKGAGTKGKNVSPEQLYFYALLYYLHFKRMPDQLGFFYYKFNCFEPIAFDLDTLNEFRTKVSLGVKAIVSGAVQDPTPSAKACKYCRYLNGCVEGTLSKTSRMRKSKLTGIEENGGIVEFGLD